MTSQNFWTWSPLSPLGGVDGSSLTKMFSRSESHIFAELLAREVIQNSWDAALELREIVKNNSLEFSMEFHYKKLSGKAKKDFIENAQLLKMYGELKTGSSNSKFMQRVKNSFEELNSSKPIELLFCVDKGGHGLSGHPKLNRDSHFYLAFYFLGSTKKQSTRRSGGSYGFGKSVWPASSALSTVFAYSSFARTPSDSVTRRLAGFGYFESFNNVDGKALYLDSRQGDGPRATQSREPFEDSAADQIAQSLGFQIRDAKRPENYGTSVLVLNPRFNAESLKNAIEKWWWPALLSPELNFNVNIFDYDGKSLPPKPRQNSKISLFVPAFSIARGDTSPVSIDKTQYKKVLNSKSSKSIGVLGLRLVSDQAQTNFEDEDDSPTGKIALIRGPRMVIQYYPLRTSRFPISGVFLADESCDELLRETENAEHNNWSTKEDDDISSNATETAKSVIRGIRAAVKTFLEIVDPPTPKDKAYLDVLANLLSPFFKGKSKGPTPPPPSEAEPIIIEFVNGPTIEKTSANQLRTVGKFKIRLANKANADEINVKVGLDLKILEDDGDSGSPYPYSMKINSSNSDFFKHESGIFEGTLVKDKFIDFEFQSDPYDKNWTSQVRINVDLPETLKMVNNG